MNKDEIEAIVKEEEEFYETTAGEKHDLADFLHNRLSAQQGIHPTALSGLEAVAFLVGLIVGLLVARFGGG